MDNLMDWWNTVECKSDIEMLYHDQHNVLNNHEQGSIQRF